MRGIRLFRLFGIDVYLHWLWFVVAFYEINTAKQRYPTVGWAIAEYLALFLIVLLHEFGHALACKSVGGQAERIMLWPLGGVAYVSPPQRPGAVLWSIAAGPLVNVILAPVIIGIFLLMKRGMLPTTPELRHFFFNVLLIDILLFVFNMLPIYPLDGGKIVWALLWFIIGRAKSLMVASGIGLVAAAATLVWAAVTRNGWFIALAIYAIMRSWSGLQQAGRIGRLLKLPRHETITCPGCGNSPPAAPLWRCACGVAFDTFATGGICPQCGRPFTVTACPHCGQAFPFEQWHGVTSVSPPAFPIPSLGNPFPTAPPPRSGWS